MHADDQRVQRFGRLLLKSIDVEPALWGWEPTFCEGLEDDDSVREWVKSALAVA
jgi:hypothetical protein